MAKTAWPTVSDVQNYLQGLGVSDVPSGVSLADEIDAAVSALESESDISPFLAGTADSYDYNAPRTRTLMLGVPFATIDSIYIGKSASSSGSALTDQVDYWAKPFGGPYLFVEFRDAQYGEPESVCVTGRRGYCTEIPVDVWNAVRNLAAAKVYEVAAMAGTVSPGIPQKIKQGGVEVDFGGSGGSGSAGTTGERLAKDALEVFARYRRPSLVGLAP